MLMGNEGGTGPVGGADNDSDSGDSEASATSSGAEGDERGQQTHNTCATCWQPIPADRVRCPHCLGAVQSGGDPPEASSYDRIVLGVVPADGTREAKATAATAFARGQRLRRGAEVSRSAVTLRAAFETALPSALTEGWPTLPEAVPLASTAGRSLFETARTRCRDPTLSDPVLYCEDGATVADGDEVATLAAVIEEADVSYWVVPGIVKRYSLPDEPDAFGDPLFCASCGAVTEHDPLEADADTADRPERRVLTCRVCGTQRRGPD